MSVTFRIEHFEGPLDLLLQLVEQEKLDISQVSLAAVAEQFVEYVQNHPGIAPEELADFLVVAAKLMYMKSRLLLPSFQDQELEEGPDLETQLREYRLFVEASKEIDARWKTGLRSFRRQERTWRRVEAGFLPPSGVTAETLLQLMQRVIARLEPIIRLPQASITRAVTIQEKIHDLFRNVKIHLKTTFHSFVAQAQSKNEAIVSFLAVLELVKQRFVRVEQGNLFQDFSIHYDPVTAPAGDPLAESFV